MRHAPVCSPPLEGCPRFVLCLSLDLSLCVSPSVFLSSCVFLLHPPRLPPLVLFRALLPRANQEIDISFNRHIFHAAGQGHLSSLWNCEFWWPRQLYPTEHPSLWPLYVPLQSRGEAEDTMNLSFCPWSSPSLPPNKEISVYGESAP